MLHASDQPRVILYTTCVREFGVMRVLNKLPDEGNENALHILKQECVCSIENMLRNSAKQPIVKQEKISAQNGKQVTKIMLDSGAVGHLATDVPEQALKGLIKKLKRQQTNLQKRSVK